MANATKLIVLPELWVPHPGVQRWIPGLIQLNHPADYASAQIVAGNADGSVVQGAGAYSANFPVTGAAYRALFGTAEGQAAAAALMTLILQAGIAASRPELTGGSIEDVQAP